MSDNGEKKKTANEMHPPKEKPKYESPTALSLNNLAGGTGMPPAVPCSTGSSPLGGNCAVGPTAGTNCSTGTIVGG